MLNAITKSIFQVVTLFTFIVLSVNCTDSNPSEIADYGIDQSSIVDAISNDTTDTLKLDTAIDTRFDSSTDSNLDIPTDSTNDDLTTDQALTDLAPLDFITDIGCQVDATLPCYKGPAGTQGIGLCKSGTTQCSNGKWSKCVGSITPVMEKCDSKDNDCDGSTDEAFTQICYSGPTTTIGIGLCHTGTSSCSNGKWGKCASEVIPTPEQCDTLDNNCNGKADENLSKGCYSGKLGTQGVGLCKQGSSTCQNGKWNTCSGQVLPMQEKCDNLDNDCNNKVDDGVTLSCYTGPVSTKGIGQCKAGAATCSKGTWGVCKGEVKPTVETCNNQDDDCDSITDESLAQTCSYTGPTNTLGVGVCKAGTQICTTGKWGSCFGEITPKTEQCNNTDDDCDSKVDEDINKKCTCTGPSGTVGVGICKASTQSCSKGVWGACSGQVIPATEVCNNKDDNCNSKTDESLNQTCYTGKSGTAGIGQCKSGAKTCYTGSWSGCVGEVTPVTETCDNKDNDCDGSKDENLTKKCPYSGASGTEGVGLCMAATQLCSTGTWGACTGEVVPVKPKCNGQDNDCNGLKDTCIAQPGPSGGMDVWITSVYYGGGLNDNKLLVGGWGDTYTSLLKFNINAMPANVSSAKIYLYCFPDGLLYRTQMYLDRVTSSWNESTKWNTSPNYSYISTLSAPILNSWYVIDVTTLYNGWKSGSYTNFGVQLRPVSTNNNTNAFRSSDYMVVPSLRPKLVVVK